MSDDLDDLVQEHSGHLVDALTAAASGCPQAAERSLQDAAIVASDIAILVDKISE